MQFIQNVSMKDIQTGNHYIDDNTILIQIQDWDTVEFSHIKFKKDFKAIYRFRFDDIDIGSNAITEDQAKDIADKLLYAKKWGQSVVVHCHAGLCRSGAVVECGVILGFADTGTKRIPNTTVKKMITKHLGFELEY